MSQQLINRSPDLKQLRDEGYNIMVKGGYLVVRQIPYVTSNREIKYGTLVSKLTLSDGIQTSKPETHVINFEGEHPCDKEGNEIIQIKHATNNQKLDEGVIINHSFSNKPPNGYDNVFQLGLVPVVRSVKCTEVHRDAKIPQNTGISPNCCYSQ